jgi:hypothetical protein
VCSVIIGNNRITNCQTLISVRERPLLQVSHSPLRVSFTLPRELPSRIFFEIVDNELNGESSSLNSKLNIVRGETNISIFWDGVLLVSATSVDPGTVHIKIDLRQLGIRIYDDHEGLHVGNNLLAHNSFMNCTTAIALS